MTLVSRKFVASDSVKTALDYTKTIFASVRKEGGLEMEIVLRPAPDRRIKKERLQNALPSGVGKWARDGYDFDFDRRRYTWNALPLHVTAGEALFLFRWLVQGEYRAAEKYYLHNLRKRYGTEFLTEAGK
jgi:hypothetical protein